MATLYIFIRNTGAIQYRVIFKPVTQPTYNPADFFIIPAQPGSFTIDSSHTVPSSNFDYNVEIIPICENGKEGSPFPILVPAACLGVTFDAIWNNCNCPSIIGITATTT